MSDTLRDAIHAEISCASPIDLYHDDPAELLDAIMAAVDRERPQSAPVKVRGNAARVRRMARGRQSHLTMEAP